MKQDQKSIFCDLRKAQAGQAIVEYVLLMVVIVGVIMGMSKVFKTIDTGMQKYIGDYFVCLMEYGELPTLGIADANLKKHVGGTGRTCDNQFEAFTFEGGRPATAGGGGSGNGNGNGNNSQNGNGRNGKGDGTGDSSSSSNDKNKDGSGSDDTSGAGEISGRGRGGSGSGGKKKPDVRNANSGFATLDGGYDDSSKSRVLEDDEEGSSDKERKKRRRPKKTTIGYAEDYRAIGGKALQEIEKNERRRSNVRKPTSTVLKVVAEDEGSGPFRKTFIPPDRSVSAEKEDKDEGFSLGGLFKWLLIAGMVIAIVIFFGGQLLNYSNSDS